MSTNDKDTVEIDLDLLTPEQRKHFDAVLQHLTDSYFKPKNNQSKTSKENEELKLRVERAEERATQAVKDREVLRRRVLDLEKERDALRLALRSLKEEG